MNDFKVSNNFYASELLAPDFFGSGLDPQWFITPFLAIVPQKFRERFQNPVLINNWKSGGNKRERGFRVPTTKIGAKFSQHKFGWAIDINITGYEPDEILADVKKNREYYEFITTYETLTKPDGTARTWNHFDGRRTNLPVLFEVQG